MTGHDVLAHAVPLGITHVAIAVPAILGSLVLSVPLARLALVNSVAGYVILQSASLLFAVPALPLLVVVPPLIGLPVTSPITLVVLLTMYGVAVMARQTAATFSQIPPDIGVAADAMGYGPLARFVHIELPIAWPSIIRALRLVSASTLSMTVGALVGIPGLGVLITEGYERGDRLSIVVGIVATMLVAAALDVTITLIGRLTTPWLRRAAA